jgi:hypothetical protein
MVFLTDSNMKFFIQLLIITFLLQSCADTNPNSTNVDLYDTSQITIEEPISTIISKDSLQTFQYPNLTAWGGLKLQSLHGQLKRVETIQNAELGYTKKIFYIEYNELYKVYYEGHHAEWVRYEESYPPDQYEWNPDKMTYSDTSFTIEFKNKRSITFNNTETLKQEGLDLLKFIKDEKIGADIIE